MCGRFGEFLIGAALLAVMAASASAATDFSGKYEGQTVSASISRNGDAYGGDIRLAGQSFPIQAHEASGRLEGTFFAGDGRFDFAATLKGDELTLVSGGATYALKRQSIANPLTTVASGAAGAKEIPSRFTVAIQTDLGKTLSIQLPGVTTSGAAYKAVFPDLEKYFGARPSITGAYQDGDDAKSGFASFDAKLDGKPVKGVVSPRFDDKGALVYVVYCQADASPAEWKKLLGMAPVKDVPLTSYDFPDGTGSIGLAAGWTTKSQSLLNITLLTGPADQQILLGLNLTACTPDSYVVRQHEQAERNAAMYHLPPPPQMPLIVAPMGDPAQTLANLVPSLSQISQKYGGPAITLDRIIDQQPQPSPRPGSHVALVRYDLTRTTDGVARHYRAASRIEVDPLTAGSYMFNETELLAPADTFTRDLPTMYAMVCSIKVNQQVVEVKTQANIKLQNEIFNSAMASAHKQEIAMGRQAADMDEILTGSRTVEDTDTGVRSSVNLADVHEIVQKLNDAGGHHYKEIPLRDEIYPGK